MVVIRLSRAGAKKRPFYNVVVADQRYPRGGRYIEKVGYFNPVASGQDVKLQLEVERVNHWISQGAQPSDRVASLLKKLNNGQAA
jgi:small subunit ribosomal protein S16